MGDQPAARGRCRSVAVPREHDVVGHGVRIGAERAGRTLGQLTGVYPELTEIVAEAMLHRDSGGAVEWYAGRAQGGVHRGNGARAQPGAGSGRRVLRRSGGWRPERRRRNRLARALGADESG
jgi:hypothetical protein